GKESALLPCSCEPARKGPLMKVLLAAAFVGFLVHPAVAAQEPAKPAAVVQSEFVYTEAPLPQCHASTLAETSEGLVAAWFGGTREGHRDVGIWVARQVKGRWSAPQEVATGVQERATDEKGKRFPCWNPVLFQPRRGPLLLFYKVGPNPRQWWSLLMTSTD